MNLLDNEKNEMNYVLPLNRSIIVKERAKKLLLT